MSRGRARILLHLHIQRGKIVLRGSRAGRRFGCRNHPFLRVCVSQEDAGERGGRAFSNTYTYSGKRESCEGAELVDVLVAETIHPACMCEGGGRGGERDGRA